MESVVEDPEDEEEEEKTRKKYAQEEEKGEQKKKKLAETRKTSLTLKEKSGIENIAGRRENARISEQTTEK